MTTLTLPVSERPMFVPRKAAAKKTAPQSEPADLLVVTDDDRFWQDFSAVAIRTGHSLFRKRASDVGLDTLRLLKPAAVLLDIDLPAPDAWSAADLLLQYEGCPALFLLTSRREEQDFDGAIQAGALLDKRTNPAVLIQRLSEELSRTNVASLQRAALQQRQIIRWFKPCDWPSHSIRLRRFWGINE